MSASAVLKMTETVANQVLLNNVRLGRVSLTKAHVWKDAVTGKQKGKYHADLILTPNHPQLEAFRALMREAVAKNFGADATAALEQIEAQGKLCLQQGDVTRAGEPEYTDKLYIRAASVDQPTIVVTEGGTNIANRGTAVVLTQSHPLWPYPGCYVNVHLSIFAYSLPKDGKGVGAQLMGVQFLRHGERLMGA
jgi:Protein of unknown function (DUF2815)